MMRTWAPATCLFLACLCVPLPSSAQSPAPSYQVSVRELSIPPKAARAFAQGLECMARKETEASLVHFQKAISEFAGYYEAYDRIGAADLKLWRLADAEQAFRKSIELSGGRYAHPLIALGANLDDRREFSEAEDVTGQGLELNQASWTRKYQLVMALYGLNRLEDAEKSILESLRQKSAFPEARLLLADIHGREQNYRALVTDLDQYLQLVPDGPSSGRARALRESALRMLMHPQSAAAIPQTLP